MDKVKSFFKRVNVGSWVVYLLLAWFIIAFLIYPNFNLILQTFVKDGEFSTRAVEKLLSSPRAMKSLRNSFVLATSMVVTVNIVGMFIVLVTEYLM